MGAVKPRPLLQNSLLFILFSKTNWPPLYFLSLYLALSYNKANKYCAKNEKKKSNYPSNWPRISKCITWQKKSVQPYWVAGRVSQRTAEVKSKCHRFLRSRPEHRTECCDHQLSTLQADLLRDIFVVESFRQMSVSSLVVESLLWFGSRQRFHFTLWSIINTLIWKFNHFRILIICNW